MNCFYCNQPCQATHYEMATDTVASETSYMCQPCGANYSYSNEHDVVYTWEFSQEGFLAIFYDKHIHQEWNFVLYKDTNVPIMHLNFIPDINPKNFKRKLPTLLTFS